MTQGLRGLFNKSVTLAAHSVSAMIHNQTLEGDSAGLQARQRMVPWLFVALVACGAAAVLYAWEGRYLFLDDAFIHLRVARSLATHGFYSFNGDSPAYCTSSPLYTALLAVLWTLFDTSFLPKLLNWVIYAVLFVMIASRAVIAQTDRGRLLWVGFMAGVSSPMAMRWLTDGMETGLSAVFALVMAKVAFDIWNEAPAATRAKLAGLSALGALAVTLRIEFSLLVAAIGVASLAHRQRHAIDRRAAALAVGAAAGLGAIYVVFGTVLPDTAVAKANALGGMTHFHAAVATLFDVVKAHVAASSLGVIILCSTLLSFYWALRVVPHRRFVLVMNGAFGLFLLLCIWRQQAIQGYRYFVFVEFFLLAFNALVVGSRVRSAPTATWREQKFSAQVAVGLCGAAFLAWQVFDFHKLSAITEGRALSYEKFVDLDTRDLMGRYGIAWDVGMIGYFSHATILDGNGLVNGPLIARMSKSERLRSFVDTHSIGFVFVDAGQLQSLQGYLDVSHWNMAQSFDFPNFSGNSDRHFLLVKPN